MGIQIIGNGGTIAEVEANSRALRTVLRPNDVGSLGAYRVAAFTGLLSGLAANTPIFSARWGDATRICLPKWVRVKYTVITGFTAAQELAYDAIIARSFSASDSAGTQIVLTGNNQKKRTSFGSSLFTDMRVAAAVTLTAGTRTLDSQAIAGGVGRTPVAASLNDQGFESVIDWTNGQDYPVIFAQNEGLIIRNVIALGAGGTVRALIEFGWEELTTY